jgi:phosphate transport system protein
MTGSEHIVKAMDHELAHLDHVIAEMGGLAERQLEDAVEALVRGDFTLAKKVIAKDVEIDDLESEIAQFVVRFLARRQPMADDLRAIVAGLKIAANIERIGDYAKNIAKRTLVIEDPTQLQSARHAIARMAKVVQEMISGVLGAYIARDVAQAKDVLARDSEVDQLNTSLFRELLTYMMEDPRQISRCTHFLFMAKNLERMGDHATGIAEQVTFIVTGETPREERAKQDASSATVLDSSDSST